MKRMSRLTPPQTKKAEPVHLAAGLARGLGAPSRATLRHAPEATSRMAPSPVSPVGAPLGAVVEPPHTNSVEPVHADAG